MRRLRPAFTRGGACHRGIAALLACSLATSGCSVANSVESMFSPSTGAPQTVNGFIGGVVADEPTAALTARQVLADGGDAADAAVALGFALAVTLPSRAGLGGGGGCLAYDASKDQPGAPEAILFSPGAPASAAGSDRPAAVPMLARGLFLLHHRYGTGSFERLVLPAQLLAQTGSPASRAFVRDLAVVAGPLAADPGARAAWFRNGAPIAEGATMIQPELGGTLAQIRTAGVGDLYEGTEARALVAAAARVGGSFTLADLRGGLAQLLPSLTMPGRGRDRVAFLPPPVDGGLATQAAFQVLLANPAALDAARAAALAAAARSRQAGASTQAILVGGSAVGGASGGSLPALPASTSFATLDRNGNAVVCVLTMNNLFGTGRVAPGTGVLLAASPAWMPPPLLAAGIVYDPRAEAFRAAVGGSGQEGAPVAAAVGLVQAESAQPPTPTAAPDPGRANIIACSRTLPDSPGSCRWATDPRGAGLALGAD